MQQRLSFYHRTIAKWIQDRQASILVGAGASNDRNVFHELGFRNVVISNLDQEPPSEQIAPYTWNQQNLEALTYPNEAFDYVVVHAGLHHCQSPHRGLLEMYRVAKKALIAFEPPDNLLVRLMQRFGLAQIYEYTAVDCHNGQCGGVNNSSIPNYIYRWTDHEIEKVISSYAPATRHRFYYEYASDEPTPEFIGTNRLKHLAIRLAKPAYRLWAGLFPRQQNLFAFMVEKPNLTHDLQPWLMRDEDEIRFNPHWQKAKGPAAKHEPD